VRDPDLKVLFMSGFSGESSLRNGLLKPGKRLIEKPFTPAALTAQIREILDRAT